MKIIKIKILFIFCAILFNVFCADAQKYNIKDVQIYWNKYIEHPLSENAASLSVIISDSISNKYSGKEEELLLTIIFKDISMLEKQIYCSDSNAVNLGFVLYRFADGSYAEKLDEILGNLIRINPHLFLKYLNRHRKRIVRLDALVSNFGPQYVDRYDAELLEAKLRIESLQKVHDKELIKLQNECINQLKKIYTDPH